MSIFSRFNSWWGRKKWEFIYSITFDDVGLCRLLFYHFLGFLNTNEHAMKHLLKSRAAKNCVRKKWKEKLIRQINNFVEEGQIELLLFNRQRESAQWKDEDWNVSVNILFAFSTTTRTLYSSHQQGFVERVLLFFVLAALDEKRSKTKKSLQVIRILFFKFRKANKSHSNETEKDSNWFHFVIETFASINFFATT